MELHLKAPWRPTFSVPRPVLSALALLLAGAGLAGGDPASAQEKTVYRSVEDGVVTFSDQPPQGASDVEAIELEVSQPGEDVDLEARLAAMRETTDRMAEDRRAREKHRAELRALKVPQEPTVPQTPAEPPVLYSGGYWPVAGLPPRPRPPFHPPYRPLPGRPHPVPLPAEPPPGWSVMGGGNDQLMRPMVSRRR